MLDKSFCPASGFEEVFSGGQTASGDVHVRQPSHGLVEALSSCDIHEMCDDFKLVTLMAASTELWSGSEMTACLAMCFARPLLLVKHRHS